MKELNFSSIFARYCVGFVASLALSLLGYFIVASHVFNSNGATMATLLLLAVVQLVVQLVCFLHLGTGGRSRDRTVTLSFTVLMMLVIVIGSLWIMKNLDYRMNMSGEAMNEYMQKQNKKGF